MRRLRLKLYKYNLKLEYLPGSKMFVADLLSRSYCTDIVDEDETVNDVIHGVTLAISDERLEELKDHTAKDEIYKKS